MREHTRSSPLFAMLSLLCSPAAAYSLSHQPPRAAVQVRTQNTQMSGRVHTPGLAGVDVDAKKTAVVFIEYQNEFTTEGGKREASCTRRSRGRWAA